MTTQRKNAAKDQQAPPSPLVAAREGKMAYDPNYYDLDPPLPFWVKIRDLLLGTLGLYGAKRPKYLPLFKEEECEVVEWNKAGTLPLVHPIPRRELLQWFGTVGLRYLTTVLTKSFPAWLRAKWWENTTEKVSDEQLNHLFQNTILSTFLNPVLDEKDLKLFAKYLPDNYAKVVEDYRHAPEVEKLDFSVLHPKTPTFKAPAGSITKFYKCDYSLQKEIVPLPGTYVTAAVGLFQRKGDDESYPVEVLCIALDGLIITPKDKAWNYAKTLLLTGSAYDILFVEHPSNAHLPMGIVNGFTKTVLPQNHSLFQLLEPHFYLHFGVNDIVRFGETSIAMMEDAMWFNCMTFGLSQYQPGGTLGGGEREALKFFRAGAHGVPGNSSYKPYTFKLYPRNIESHFWRFLRSFYPVVLDFVTKTMRDVSHIDDAAVAQWADKIAANLPGFPTAAQMAADRQVFIRAVTMIIWLESIEHSTTHHSFGYALPRAKIPFRVRQPIPTSPNADVNYQSITTVKDRMQSILAWGLFFEDKPVTKLVSCKYHFTEPHQKEALTEFRDSLKGLSKMWGKYAIIPINQIAPSVQY